jgi:hypothetical protein
MITVTVWNSPTKLEKLPYNLKIEGTHQEIFDTVVLHLAKQGKPAIDPKTNYCCYRINGLSCAAGCLIPDNLYHENMENISIFEILSGHGHDSVENLIRELQSAHDNSIKLQTLKLKLINIAKKFNLNKDAVKEIKVWRY